ncbi:hypothetical protein BDV25DRAFT_169803 [Aspergillus avenaceus]|uniref:Alcohol acetyltransferase n=1 Tax=Aspergillus avenaceus TaxID=36643 RepID=A0A5N6TJT2_ASPAV|nr:hypothetical protein BDV25DRAFT_169803 [Aspergillus avenaceus]
MPWTQVTENRYQRAIGENERFIKAIGDRAHAVGREHWSVTAYGTFTLHENVKRSSADVTAWLRQAWQVLRFQHPSIASTASDEILEYVVPAAQELEEWTRDTFTVVHDGTVDDVVASIKPSPFVTAYYLPHRSQIILHLAHWRTDGYGALQLLNAFFESCTALSTTKVEALPWGTEVERLVPSVEEALANPVESTEEIHAAARKYLATTANIPGAVGVSQTTELSTPPSGTRSARLRLSTETTEAISEACDARGISVLAAVHASTAATTYELAHPDAKQKHYTSTMRFSLRPYLPEQYRNPSVAAGIYTGGYMAKVPATQSWLDNAKLYTREYDTGVTDDFLISRRQYARDVFERMKTPPPPPVTPPSEIDISSVDDATKLVHPWHGTSDGKLEVNEVSVGVETLTRQMYCFVWMFRGSLELSVVYNQAFYEGGFVKGAVERVARVLEGNLGLVFGFE